MKQGVLKSVAWLELIVFFIPVLAWPLFAFMSIFVFDAPGSEKNWILLSLVGIALGYPALYVLALIKTLQNFKNKNNFYFPWELQIWDAEDMQSNIQNHEKFKRNFI